MCSFKIIIKNFWKSGDQKLLKDLCVLILRDSLDLKLRYCKLDFL